VRVVAALALVVVNVGLVTVAAAAPTKVDGIIPPPPTVSDCYVVMVSPPAGVRPTVTVCQP
jgi:hypothetical protein